MPMHDWTRVYDGIYHAFHHEWISEISRALNRGLLSQDYYALAEQHAGAFGPDVLTLQGSPGGNDSDGGVVTLTRTKPKTSQHVESPAEFYRRKQNAIAVRHVSGDRVVAMIEIVSPGNKDNRRRFQAFVDNATQLLTDGVHLVILDPFPPGPRDPQGIHAAIWESMTDQEFELDPTKPLAMVSYDAGVLLEAYIEPLAVGDALKDMPLFLEPGGHVLLPLETTYMAAWDTVPARWQRVVAPE